MTAHALGGVDPFCRRTVVWLPAMGWIAAAPSRCHTFLCEENQVHGADVRRQSVAGWRNREVAVDALDLQPLLTDAAR
jgi:hypothetical protein